MQAFLLVWEVNEKPLEHHWNPWNKTMVMGLLLVASQPSSIGQAAQAWNRIQFKCSWASLLNLWCRASIPVSPKTSWVAWADHSDWSSTLFAELVGTPKASLEAVAGHYLGTLLTSAFQKPLSSDYSVGPPPSLDSKLLLLNLKEM